MEESSEIKDFLLFNYKRKNDYKELKEIAIIIM